MIDSQTYKLLKKLKREPVKISELNYRFLYFRNFEYYIDIIKNDEYIALVEPSEKSKNKFCLLNEDFFILTPKGLSALEEYRDGHFERKINWIFTIISLISAIIAIILPIWIEKNQ